jgi:hypothetical protein
LIDALRASYFLVASTAAKMRWRPFRGDTSRRSLAMDAI